MTDIDRNGDGGRVRILIVEDDESYQEALHAGLSMEGYDVELASDGPDGLRRFADHPPDLVLLDVLLPGMVGTEVCKRMRDIAPVPVIMVSALNSEIDVVLGLELGAADLCHQAVPDARARRPHPSRLASGVAARVGGSGSGSGSVPAAR